MKQKEYLKTKNKYKKEDVHVNSDPWQKTYICYTTNGYQMKRQIVTDEFYQQAEHIIYNDLSTDDLYPISKSLDYFNEDVVRNVILPHEKWVKVYAPDGEKAIAYTSFGRVINTKTVKLLKATATRNNLLHTIQEHTFKSSEIFKQQGWDHDIQDLVKRYVDNRWKISLEHYPYTL